MGYMGIVSWVVLGGIAGWVASLIMGRDDQLGCLMNIVVGILGAVIGGIVVNWFVGGGFYVGFNLTSLVVAVLAAVGLLAIVNLLFGKK